MKRQKLVTNMGGLVILGGHTEPAWDTVYRIRSFMRIGEVEWIPWDECPSRDSEKAAKEGKKKWIADPASGIVKEVTLKATPEVDTSTTYAVSVALQRRGLAAEMAGFMSYATHERIRTRWVAAVTDDATDLRYLPPSLHQARADDKSALSAGHHFPATDDMVKDLFLGVQINLILLPRAGGSASGRPFTLATETRPTARGRATGAPAQVKAAIRRSRCCAPGSPSSRPRRRAEAKASWPQRIGLPCQQNLEGEGRPPLRRVPGFATHGTVRLGALLAGRSVTEASTCAAGSGAGARATISQGALCDGVPAHAIHPHRRVRRQPCAIPAQLRFSF